MFSLETPPSQIMEDSDTFASYLKSTATSLLSFVGITADPLDSKEYILLAQIIIKVWLSGEDLDIESIIGAHAGLYCQDTRYFTREERS